MNKATKFEDLSEKRVQITFSGHRSTYKLIQQRAADIGVSTSLYLCTLIDKHLEEEQLVIRAKPTTKRAKTSYYRSRPKRDAQYKPHAILLDKILEEKVNRKPTGRYGLDEYSGILGTLAKRITGVDPEQEIMSVLEWLYSDYDNLKSYFQITSCKIFATRFFDLLQEKKRRSVNGHHINGHHVNGHEHHKSVKFLFHRKCDSTRNRDICLKLFNDAKQIVGIKSTDQSPESIELANNIITLIDDINQTRWDGAPGAHDFVDEYTKWLDEPNYSHWVKYREASIYRPESGVFKRFCKWYGEHVLDDRDPLTGEYY